MSIVACPKCVEDVSLPPRVPKEAVVRCPLCCEQFLLAEAMSSLPPMLEVVELPVGYRAEEELASTHALVGAGVGGGYTRNDFRGGLAEEAAEPGEFQMEDTAAESGFQATETGLHPTGPSVKRQLLHPPGAKKRKSAGGAIGTMIAIIFGGVMAIPCALMLLLWLPKEYHKDPFNVAPLLNEHAPYLLPEHLQKSAKSGTKTVASNNPNKLANNKPPANDNSTPAAPAENQTPDDKKSEGGLDFGNKFDNALKGVNSESSNNENPNTPAEEPKLPEIPNVPEPNIPEPNLGALPGTEPEGKTDPEMKKEPEVPLNPLETSEEPLVPTPNLAKMRQAREQLENKITEYDIAAAGTDNEARKAAIRAMYQAGASMANVLPKNNIGAEDVFDAFLADPKKLNYLGVLAPGTLDATERPHDGILLFGTVKTCRQGESACEVNVEVNSRDKRVIAVIGPEMTEGATVFIAGKISEDPKQLLPDFAGVAPRAVQALFVLEVPQ